MSESVLSSFGLGQKHYRESTKGLEHDKRTEYDEILETINSRDSLLEEFD